jgi:hypothetical protein
MYSLDVAIQQFWNLPANQATLGPVGQLFATLMPAGTQFTRPYCVVFLPPSQGGKPLRSFGTPGNRTAAEKCQAQFTVFAAPRAQAAQYIDLVASVFDDAQLNLATGYAIQCVRSRATVVISDIPTYQDENGNQVYQGIAFYDILVDPG